MKKNIVILLITVGGAVSMGHANELPAYINYVQQDATPPYTPLMQAVGSFDLQAVTSLVSNGADINEAVWQQTTPGHYVTALDCATNWLLSTTNPAKKQAANNIIEYLIRNHAVKAGALEAGYTSFYANFRGNLVSGNGTPILSPQEITNAERLMQDALTKNQDLGGVSF